jgi:hypothetical protein
MFVDTTPTGYTAVQAIGRGQGINESLFGLDVFGLTIIIHYPEPGRSIRYHSGFGILNGCASVDLQS